MPIYKEKHPRLYDVIQLTKEMLQEDIYLPKNLGQFVSAMLYPEKDCIVYYGKKNTVIRANHGAKIHPKVGDYLGTNIDGDLRYWLADDFLDFYEKVK